MTPNSEYIEKISSIKYMLNIDDKIRPKIKYCGHLTCLGISYMLYKERRSL